MEGIMKEIELRSINAIRVLSIDQVQAANSGHPGMPLGVAPIAYTLFRKVMRYNPADPSWKNRDRFVMSGGHGSALLYSILHLSGYDIPLAELKRFRQLNSLTPGHPEYMHTPGVDTTTGPLGQGVANAVGFAMAEQRLAAQFNTDGENVIDHYTYCVCGDGDMMEGISSEAASLAGTLKLGKLILIYDDNEISIEGNTDIAFRENVNERFKAYGWQVIDVQDGNNAVAIENAILAGKADERPTLIVCHTVIGYGSPKAGHQSVHGEPLGKDALAATKSALGYNPDEFFTVPDDVYAHMNMRTQGEAWQREWEAKLSDEKRLLLDEWYDMDLDSDALWEFLLQTDSAALYGKNGKAATRNTGGVVLNRIAEKLPNLIGGSADLAPSNKSNMSKRSDFSDVNRGGSNLHFGVREHAMASICNAIALHGGLRPYCATFFVFSDYMRGAMRVSALSKIPVTYILTHDSIGVGEDGPTHQPVEQLESLRAVPNMLVFRPADSREVIAGWITALTEKRPTCLILTRQDLPQYEASGPIATRGGYVISDCKHETPDVILMASGSEVEQMIEAQGMLADKGIDARVVSIPCMELFDEQDEGYRESVLPRGVRARVAMEASVGLSFQKYVGLDGEVIRMKGFGACGPANLLFEKFGFTAQNAVETAIKVLKK